MQHIQVRAIALDVRQIHSCSKSFTLKPIVHNVNRVQISIDIPEMKAVMVMNLWVL